MGYIELFDSIEFNSKGKWDNQITVSKETNKDKENSSNTVIKQSVDFLA